MVTENEQLARNIEALDKDLDEAGEDLKEQNAYAIKDLITTSTEDVEMCLAMWEQIKHVGEEFERGGRIAKGTESLCLSLAMLSPVLQWL
jgi:hypothetical protein